MEEEQGRTKDSILRNIYYDVDEGFQSAQSTYKDAKKIRADITLDYVKQWLTKQQSRQLKPYTGFNLEVAVDLADFSRSAECNDGYA